MLGRSATKGKPKGKPKAKAKKTTNDDAGRGDAAGRAETPPESTNAKRKARPWE
jgi:hypothetical protein